MLAPVLLLNAPSAGSLPGRQQLGAWGWGQGPRWSVAQRAALVVRGAVGGRKEEGGRREEGKRRAETPERDLCSRAGRPGSGALPREPGWLVLALKATYQTTSVPYSLHF